MKKILDLEPEVNKKTHADIWNAAHALGVDRYDDEKIGFQTSRDLKDAIGLCAGCKYLNYCRTEWGNIYAKCYEFDIRIPYGNRMEECTNYEDKGALSLQHMISMAILIDINKTKIGLLAKKE